MAVYKEIIDKKGVYILPQINCKLVYGDEPMIKSIIRNLIDNAIKNTPNGSIIITSGYSPNEELCEIIIADEGKGMTEEEIVAMNKYFRSDDDILPFSILGYGHKVIKDFVHKQRGTIRYRQNVPSGIIATVVLPVTGSPE
ncbi:MAG: ATP-binding protein [Chitinophagaceae bacterium]